ncbi:MAG: hypothetical protein ACI8ZN_001817 [Bacteroidia bacterium]|jgi:hypothetical protein
MKTRRIAFHILILLSLCLCSCGYLGKNEGNLTEGDLDYINKIIPPGSDEIIELFTSNHGIYTVEKSGNFITNKRLASYWISDEENETSTALYAQIDSIKTVDLVSTLTYASYIEVFKKDGTVFKVYIDANKVRTKEFFDRARTNWEIKRWGLVMFNPR